MCKIVKTLVKEMSTNSTHFSRRDNLQIALNVGRSLDQEMADLAFSTLKVYEDQTMAICTVFYYCSSTTRSRCSYLKHLPTLQLEVVYVSPVFVCLSFRHEKVYVQTGSKKKCLLQPPNS